MGTPTYSPHVVPSTRGTPDLCDMFIAVNLQCGNHIKNTCETNAKEIEIYNFENKNRPENKIKSIIIPTRSYATISDL